MVGWHHRLTGHEFEEIPGDGEGKGNLAVHGVHRTERLNNTGVIRKVNICKGRKRDWKSLSS